MQKEIITYGALLNESGQLAQVGYAKSLLLNYDRNAIQANSLRIKEWDYYLITNDRFGLALTIADNSYMSLISASFLDFTKPHEKTTSLIIPFTMGKIGLPASSAVGDVSFSNKRLQYSFKHENGNRILHADFLHFDQDKYLTADIILTDEPKDSMVIATPFPHKPKAFYYNQKIIGMKASGTVTYDDQTYTFSNADSYGMLDWGRGVWTYDNTWYWGAGQGMVENHSFGFNIGYGFGDTSAASENMLFYDGISHKLEAITFDIPIKMDGSEDYLKPWRFTSSDKRFEMDFMPIIDRKALTSLGVLMSDQHQVFGYFNGSAVLDDGTVIVLKDFLGFAEKVRNKW